MSQDYFYRSIQFVSVFERNPKIREKVFLYESALKEHFRNPFKIIAISDDEDPNIPRFEAIESKSNISVNQVRLAYTENFETLKDVEKIRSLFAKRISLIQPLIGGEKTQFIAYVVVLKFPFENNQEIFKVFKEQTEAKPASLNDLMEFSIFYAKPFKNEFFLNVNCSRYEESTFEIKAGDQTLREVGKKFGIEVIIDLNTKYRYNKKEPFYELLLSETEKELFEIISKKNLNDFLSGGIE